MTSPIDASMNHSVRREIALRRVLAPLCLALALAFAVEAMAQDAPPADAPTTSSLQTAEPAGPLEACLPDDVEVSIRLNARKLLDAVELEPLRGFLFLPGAQQARDMIAQWIGIDLQTDIDEVVLGAFHGKARKDEGIALFRGRLSEARVRDGLQWAQQFQVIPVGSRSIFSWFDEKEGKLNHAVFVDARTVAVGPRDRLEAMLAAIDTPGRRLTDQPAFATSLQGLAGNPLLAILVRPPLTPEVDPNSRALWSLIDGLTLTLDVAGDLALALDAQVADDAAAAHIREIAEGLLAVAQLQERLSDIPALNILRQRFPQLAELAGRVAVTQGGPHVTASLSMPVSEARELIALTPKGRQLLGN